MDEYVIILLGEGKNVPTISLKKAFLGEEQEMSSPYVESLLQTQVGERFGMNLSVSDDPKKCNRNPQTWSVISDWTILAENINHVSLEKLSDVLFEMAEELPAPGSYILNIFWAVGDLDEADSLRNWSSVLGALRKLCHWHNGHLKAYTNGKATERTLSIIGFVDEDAEVIEEDMNDITQCDDVIWCGNLDVLSQGTPLHSLPGFALVLDKSRPQPEINVYYEDNKPSTSEGRNESFCEENKEHIWFNSSINLLEFVDINTVPLFLLSGKKFILQYHCNDNGCREQVEYLQDILNSRKSGAFLCSLEYTISSSRFDPIPEYSTKNWQQAIMNNPENLSAPKFRFRHNMRLLHFLLYAKDNKNEENAENEKITQFTAHLFHSMEDINASALINAEMKKSLYKPEPISKGECEETGEKLEFPMINPDMLFHKDKMFNSHMTDYIKQLTDSTNTSKMTLNVLRDAVQKTLQTLNTAQDRGLHDTASMTNNPKPTAIENLVNLQRLSSETEHTLQLQALKNKENLKKDTEKKLNKMKSGDSIRGAVSTKSSGIDMHLQPFDVLKYFLPSGEPKNIEPIQMNQANENIPSPGKLNNFDLALNLSYHGIIYNIDERAAEKRDRMFRRLVERQVKFETSSLGSDGKVPSPATMNIADSPPTKRSSLANEGGTENQKRKQLQKVAEKLYKRRTQSRSSVSSTSARPTTSMVLRSTPTKSQRNLMRRSSTVSLRSTSSSVENPTQFRRMKSLTQIPNIQVEAVKEEKRMRRKSYVQDNKKRLLDLISTSLIEHGVDKTSKTFCSCSKRLYNVSMAFLRDLKTSKDLDKIMKQTVENNVNSVISFNGK